MRRELISIALPTLAIIGSVAWQARTNARVERDLERVLMLVEHAKSPGASSRPCVSSPDPTLIQSEVRAAIRELGASPSAPSDPPRPVPAAATRNQDPVPEAAGEEKSAQAIQAFDDANRLVDSALARRTWSPDDVIAFRALEVHLDAQSRDDVTRRIVQAVNTGRLEPTAGRHGLF